MRQRQMILWYFGAMAALGAGLSAAGEVESGAQAVSLTVSEHADHAVALEAACLIPRSTPAVWRALSDYDHLAEFIPFLTESRIIRVTPEGKMLRQRGKATLLVFHRRFDVTFLVTEAAPREIHFEAVAGDFRRFTGSWHLEARPGGTFVRHEVEIQPKFYMPVWLMRVVERYVMLKSMHAVIARCLAAPT